MACTVDVTDVRVNPRLAGAEFDHARATGLGEAVIQLSEAKGVADDDAIVGDLRGAELRGFSRGRVSYRTGPQAKLDES